MRPKLLDLFCCAGGAARGYADAGFSVYGVDCVEQKRYPYGFARGDALEVLRLLISGESILFDRGDLRTEQLTLRDFSAIHASPPCQGYTDMRAPGQVGAPRLIGPVRRLLLVAGLPYVIENVEGAADEMLDPLTLCGSMFGLGCEGPDGTRFHLERHRLFETSWPIRRAPQCAHQAPVVGVYGGHARNRSAQHGGRKTRDIWPRGHKAAMSEAMGIDWMTTAEMSEAIPPAYTQWIGEKLRSHLNEL